MITVCAMGNNTQTLLCAAEAPPPAHRQGGGGGMLGGLGGMVMQGKSPPFANWCSSCFSHQERQCTDKDSAPP